MKIRWGVFPPVDPKKKRIHEARTGLILHNCQPTFTHIDAFLSYFYTEKSNDCYKM